MRSRKFLPVLLLFFVITVLFIVKSSLAKYAANFNGEDSAVIAIMASDVTTSFSTVGAEPGSITMIPFSITNTANGKTCEVTQTYKIAIERSNNIPFEFDLCKDSSCNNVVSKVGTYYSDSSFKLNAGVPETNNYYLRVYWPSNKNDASYSLEVDYIRLKINAVQVD